MRAFVFRLESVLTLRAAEEKTALEIYGRALQSVARAEKALTDALGDLHRLNETLQSSRSVRFQKNDQIITLNAIGYQREVCARESDRLRRVQEEAQIRLDDLLQAKRAHEALLRLRLRQQLEHAREMNRREQVAIDDLVTARYAARLHREAA